MQSSNPILQPVKACHVIRNAYIVIMIACNAIIEPPYAITIVSLAIDKVKWQPSYAITKPLIHDVIPDVVSVNVILHEYILFYCNRLKTL